jgi:tetratricopeptide (TPR) repeat protein
LNPLRHAWYWALARFLRLLGDAHRHFGNVYSNRAEYQAAVNNYTRAIGLDPTYAQAYYSRGVLYWREFGDCEPATQDLTSVLELVPSWAEAYFNRAMAYKLLGDQERAVRDFELFLQEGKDPFWLDATQRQLAELREGTEEDDRP